MTFDINNPFHRDAATVAVKLLLETDFPVGIIPAPIRDNESIPDGYVFTMDDFVLPEGASLPSVDSIWAIAEPLVLAKLQEIQE